MFPDCEGQHPVRSLSEGEMIARDFESKWSRGIGGTQGERTDRIVFHHAHGLGRARAAEGVEETRHGLREQAHDYDAGFSCGMSGQYFATFYKSREEKVGGEMVTFLCHYGGIGRRVVETGGRCPCNG